MRNKSNHRNDSHAQPPDADQPEQLDVIEPGSNPPSLADVNRQTLAKLTTNADGIICSLIHQAKRGHFQAAQLALSEMHRLGSELKLAGDEEHAARLKALVDSIEADFREEQTRKRNSQSQSKLAAAENAAADMAFKDSEAGTQVQQHSRANRLV